MTDEKTPGTRTPWSDPARETMHATYRFWVANRRPPNLLDLHQATGLGYLELRRAFRELQGGFACSVQDTRLQLSVLRMVPFSATPTPLAAYLEGEFLSYLGCPGEMMTVGMLPLLENNVLGIRSYCECCFEPINLEIKQQTVLSAGPAEPLVVVTGAPWSWERGVVCDFACDNFHFVLDREHGERFERQHGRRGTYLTLDQLARSGTAEVGRRRMRAPDDGPMVLDGDAMVTHLAAVGVDVSEWKVNTEQPPTSVRG